LVDWLLVDWLLVIGGLGIGYWSLFNLLIVSTAS